MAEVRINERNAKENLHFSEIIPTFAQVKEQMYEEMKGIDYTDKTLYEDKGYGQKTIDKEFYTPEEAYELVMSDVKSVYDLKDAV